jgi:hypothetical protein
VVANFYLFLPPKREFYHWETGIAGKAAPKENPYRKSIRVHSLFALCVSSLGGEHKMLNHCRF